MAKTNRTKKPIRFNLNDGELIVDVDHRGAVYAVDENANFDDRTGKYSDRKYLELSAKELDAIAARSKHIISSLRKIRMELEAAKEKMDRLFLDDGIRDETRTCHHSITFCDSDNDGKDSMSAVSNLECAIEYIENADIDIEASVAMGCQTIMADDIEKVHAASLKQRGLKARR